MLWLKKEGTQLVCQLKFQPAWKRLQIFRLQAFKRACFGSLAPSCPQLSINAFVKYNYCSGILFWLSSQMAKREPMEREDKQASSPMSRYLPYDIFLSFRGEDTRYTFTAYLHQRLQQHYRVFMDEHRIQCGDNIATTLHKAIRDSRLSIVVFSNDYASSTSCLEELVTIMECYRDGRHHVLPIFYHVSPQEARNQEGKFAEPFARHVEDYKQETNKVDRWRAALREIGGLKGKHVEKGKRREFEVIEEIVEEVGQLIVGIETVESPFPTSELVGQEFERAKNEVYSLLTKDDALKVGVYGMGGVGKTALMTHIYNKMIERSCSFPPVYWITVSQDFSICKLQNLIASSIGLDISKEDDVKIRAAKLNKELSRKQKLILILDDLWDYFDEKVVGLPLTLHGCKLVFTTRSLDVCKRMGSQQNIVKVKPLAEEEAWVLFKKEIVQLDPNVEQVAKLVAKECAGLPLGIITMARCMRGVDDPCEWRDALVELRESKTRKDDMGPEVFRILRFSYVRLNDLSLQQCFLYCSLFPEDFKVTREHLINLLIDEGIIEPKNYRRNEVDKGHVMLNKLNNLCLLEDCENHKYEKCVKMHDLIRDMALQILREGSSVMVEAGMQLEELPGMNEWKEDLVRVSLTGNHIKGITSSQSPMCPKLSTLLLCFNDLEFIADSFFQQFSGLQVLDLSETSIRILPKSISTLVKLTALVLRDCPFLTYIPSLAKLQELKTLDLCDSGIGEVPHGMELLLNLRYLDMHCHNLAEFPAGILPNLLHLQFLRLYHISVVKGEEVGGLRHLKDLECGLFGIVDYNNYLQSQNHLALDSFHITVYPDFYIHKCVHIPVHGRSSKNLEIWGCDVSRGFHKLPQGIKHLEFERCKGPRSLSPLNNASELKAVHINMCDGLEFLVSSSGSSMNEFKSLETLYLRELNRLTVLLRSENGLPHYGSTFVHLRKFVVYRCHRMKKLFPCGLLPNLKSLEEIRVIRCSGMEDIIASAEGEETMEEEESLSCTKDYFPYSNKRLKTEFSLPKLRLLLLIELPRLKTICRRRLLMCMSLQEIEFSSCPMLKRIPLAPPLPSFQRIEVESRDWWEQLEWDHPDVKNILHSGCHFPQGGSNGAWHLAELF